MARRKPLVRIVRPLRGGQITIPSEFRKELGLTEDTLLQVTLEDGELRVRPVRVTESTVGSPWVKELYDLYAPVREEAAKCTEAEVDAAIDEAVKSVRAKDA